MNAYHEMQSLELRRMADQVEDLAEGKLPKKLKKDYLSCAERLRALANQHDKLRRQAN